MPPRRILLIEDDPDIQKMVSLALRFTAGSEVETAPDGATGLRLARERRPELILLDCMLPDTDGYAVCRALKEDPVTGAIPVIFLSARTQAEEIEQGLALGAAGYLVKPFDPMTLAAEIDRILGG
ncbi:MAG: response regulator [Bacillota bacterium]|nr:MAG: two-component system response regulator [Bacillota bacterium]